MTVTAPPFPQGRNTTRARAQSSTARGQDRVRDVARHVSVLQGDAARAGGDLELLHRRPRCGSPPPPLNQRRLPARGFPDRRARSTARRATARPAVVLRPEPLSALHANTASAMSHRKARGAPVAAEFSETDNRVQHSNRPTQGSCFRWWCPPSGIRSRAPRPCLRPTRTRSPSLFEGNERRSRRERSRPSRGAAGRPVLVVEAKHTLVTPPKTTAYAQKTTDYFTHSAGTVPFALAYPFATDALATMGLPPRST